MKVPHKSKILQQLEIVLRSDCKAANKTERLTPTAEICACFKNTDNKTKG